MTSGTKVTVITDIMAYVKEILPHINTVVDQYGLGFHSSLTAEQIVRWIVAKVYWDVFNYETYRIIKDDTAMLMIFNEVNKRLDGRLTDISLGHIAVLRSFDQYREVDIEIKGRDLFTYYYGEVSPTFYNLQQWN